MEEDTEQNERRNYLEGMQEETEGIKGRRKRMRFGKKTTRILKGRNVARTFFGVGGG